MAVELTEIQGQRCLLFDLLNEELEVEGGNQLLTIPALIFAKCIQITLPFWPEIELEPSSRPLDEIMSMVQFEEGYHEEPKYFHFRAVWHKQTFRRGGIEVVAYLEVTDFILEAIDRLAENPCLPISCMGLAPDMPGENLRAQWVETIDKILEANAERKTFLC